MGFIFALISLVWGKTWKFWITIFILGMAIGFSQVHSLWILFLHDMGHMLGGSNGVHFSNPLPHAKKS